MGNKITNSGNSAGSVNIIGNKNRVTVSANDYGGFVDPSDVDVKAEIEALRVALAALNSPEQGKLDRAMEDAVEEAEKESPDKEEVGSALERATKYAKEANSLSEHIEKIAPRMVRLASWLGPRWHYILATLGIATGAG